MSLTHISEEPDQEKRIAKLREELERLGGSTKSLAEMPADMEEEFLRHVLEYETAEPTTVFQLLENSGVKFVPSNELDEGNLREKLMEVINRMASLGAYLLHTDHLSDRELYDHLYHDSLREEAVLFPENSSYAYFIDLTGSGSEEDNQVYLRYYADEEHRRQWAHDWPDDLMPDHEEPPFDRDRHLPQSSLG